MKWEQEIERIMHERGMDKDYRGFYPLKNLSAMCEKIYQAIHSPGDILLVQDYDVDGVSSGYIMNELCKYLGRAPRVRFSRRFSDGYGLNPAIIDEIDNGTVIAVDSGIVAFDAVSKAKAKGLTVLIVDHHEPKRENGRIILPEADMILNPKAISDPGQFKEYCAAGLALRIAEEMVKDAEILKKMTVFAMLGTIADVVPLVKDNRRIVVDGLKAFNEGNCGTVGLNILLGVLGLKAPYVTERDCAFWLNPTLNAPGRVRDNGAAKAFECVSIDKAEKEYEALSRAVELRNINDFRKRTVKTQLAIAEEIIRDNQWEDKKPIIIADETFHEGIVGIIAGEIAKKYNTPAFVLTYPYKDTSHVILKGSARTSGGVNVKSLLDAVQQDLAGYGGHAGAAGLRVRPDMLDKFRLDAEKELAGHTFEKKGVRHDIEISIADIGMPLVEKVRKYAPYGEKNPPLLFKVSGIEFIPVGGSYFSYMGEDNEHFRMTASNGVKIVGFRIAEKLSEMGVNVVKAKEFDFVADAVGIVSLKYYNEKVEFQLEVEDIVFYRRKQKKTEVYQSFENLLAFC